MAKEPEKEDKDAKAATEGEAAAHEGEKKSKKKLVIILAVVGLILVGGGGLAAMKFMGAAGKKEAVAEKHEAEDKEKGKSVFYPLGDILVNLSGEGKRPNYLKVKVSLELANAEDVPVLDAIKPRIIDNFQVYLRELRVDDLRGSAGLYRLREELLLRVTEAAQPVRVRDVLFQEMLIQ